MTLVPRPRLHGAALLLLVAAACGAPSAPARPAQSRPKEAARSSPTPVPPVDITVQATRVGGSVRLDIHGVGYQRPENHPMEQPRNWTITAWNGDEELKRMVNGPVRVSRNPTGPMSLALWNITVEFSLAFAVPPHLSSIRVHIQPPGAAPYQATIPIPGEP